MSDVKALLFGSIGAVVETSELQRAAFNAAFEQHDLGWYWDRARYRDMLGTSGGRARIAAFAERQGVSVDAGAVHESKTQHFEALLRDTPPAPRPGVLDSLNAARQAGVRTGFVSLTDARTLAAVLAGHDGALRALFDVVTSAEDGYAAKPAREAYQAVCARLDVACANALVVEDNAPGLQAAQAAGTQVVAFLGANTQDHSIAHADWSARDTVFPVILGALMAPKSAQAA